MFKDSSGGGRVLRNEECLTPVYQPDQPVARDEEINRIVEALRPLAHQKPPENLLLYGAAGVGKTTCARYVLDKLDEETSIRTISINCWQYNTRPSLLTELLIQLGYPAPRKGKPIDELLSKLREWLDKNRGVAVLLDEFDQLDAGTEVAYDFQLLNQEAQNNIGLLAISNQPPDELELDPRSHSRLNWTVLEFEPYTETQLQDILAQRSEQAFKPGVVHEEFLESVALEVYENSGDCRRALGKLLRAGRDADRRNQTKIGDRSS